MNKIFCSILSVVALCTIHLSIVSCDDINEAERVIKGEANGYVKKYETSIVVVDGEAFRINDEHRLLVADFTGWNCVNCPTVAEYITSKITPVYPSVLVSLHMVSNDFSKNHPNGFNCASADSIANWIYGSEGATKLALPSVSIDNIAYNGQVFINATEDLGNLASARNKACNVDKSALQANISINVKESSKGHYEISTLVMCPKLSNCTLRLWLIEEGLISRIQQSLSGWITNYENHGILRQVINGSYEGQNINLNADGQAVVHTSLNIDGSNYNAQNCHVVAFITAPDNKEVINCTEVELVQE